MQGKIITISRQCGSGGHSIGSELAKRLDVPFYDKEIIEMAAKESGFHQEFIEQQGEHMNGSLLFNIARHVAYAGRGSYADYQPLQDQLYFTQVKVIKELVEKGPSVIVGRCADYILRDRKDVLNVFIHADMAFKKKHCMERGQFSEENMEDMIRRSISVRAGSALRIVLAFNRFASIDRALKFRERSRERGGRHTQAERQGQDDGYDLAEFFHSC